MKGKCKFSAAKLNNLVFPTPVEPVINIPGLFFFSSSSVSDIFLASSTSNLLVGAS